MREPLFLIEKILLLPGEILELLYNMMLIILSNETKEGGENKIINSDIKIYASIAGWILFGIYLYNVYSFDYIHHAYVCRNEAGTNCQKVQIDIRTETYSDDNGSYSYTLVDGFMLPSGKQVEFDDCELEKDKKVNKCMDTDETYWSIELTSEVTKIKK